MECHSARTPGRAFTIALGLIALITPLAVHLFFPVIPAVKVALGLSRRPRAAHLQHRAVRHGLRHAVLRLAVGPLRPAAGAAVGAGAVPVRQRRLGDCADTGERAGAGAAGPGDRRRLRADAGARHRARRLSRRATGQGDRLSDHVRHARADDLADHRRRADRHARLAQRVRLRARWPAARSRSPPIWRCTRPIRSPTATGAATSVAQSYVALFSRLRFNAFVLQERLQHRRLHGDGERVGVADDRAAASAGHRVRALFPAVPDRILHRQFHLDPHRQPRLDRDDDAGGRAAGAWRSVSGQAAGAVAAAW